jgi:hypothetical protein
MALADAYAALKRHDYLTGEGSSLWYRENLRAALTEALKNKQDLYTSQERVQNSPESVHIAQPVWGPLSDEQIQEIYISEYNKGHHGRDFETAFARAIEHAHNIGGDK